jgi:holo-[acyl-carrier protein] synthase
LITGIGIDMVQIRRMERWRQRPGLLERYFHPGELAAVLAKKGGAVHSLAARFAAKEAFGKALGTGFAGMALRDIMVVSHPSGRPEMQVMGTAMEALKKNGANRIHLSLTHEQDNAAAMVVLEVL